MRYSRFPLTKRSKSGNREDMTPPMMIGSSSSRRRSSSSSSGRSSGCSSLFVVWDVANECVHCSLAPPPVVFSDRPPTRLDGT